MGKIINMLVSLIVYFCVATVITLTLIGGYLRFSDRLTNDKMFRLVAVMQDVDLQKIAASAQKSKEEVPPAELSLAEVMNHQQLLDRNYEVKKLALERGKKEYDASLQGIVEQIERYDRIAQEWHSKLKQDQEQTTQQNVTTVVNQLEQVAPEVGKDLLMRWIADNKMDDAILLMSKMSDTKLAKVLKTFETPEELKKLHEIQERIIGNGADKSKLEKALGELDAMNSGK